MAHPGDFADLRRQAQDLRAVVQAGLDLTALLTEAPRDVPEHVARRLCELTEAHLAATSSCVDGDRLRLAVSIDGGELDESRLGDSWTLDDWIPESGAPDTLPGDRLRAPTAAGGSARAARCSAAAAGRSCGRR